MIEIKIEKNVTMPQPYKPNPWPFKEMKVGDSFEIPDELLSKLSSAMVYFGRRYRMRFSKRGNRVWRTK